MSPKRSVQNHTKRKNSFFLIQVNAFSDENEIWDMNVYRKKGIFTCRSSVSGQKLVNRMQKAQFF